MGFECSAHEGRLYLWASGGAGELNSLLDAIGLGNVKRERAYVWTPEASGLFEQRTEPVVPLGVDTWARLWPEWLDGAPAVGDSAVFWAHSALFVWRLMANWGYLPVLERGREGYEARWAPRFTGESRRYFEELLAAMPESARALCWDADRRPETPRRAVLEGVLGWMLDAHARRIAGKVGQRFPASSLYSKWQTALSHPIAVIQADRNTLERFQSGILDWQKGVDLEGVCGYRLIFRVLEPPAGQTEGWMVQPLIEDLLEPGRQYPLQGIEKLALRGGELAADGAWRNFELAMNIYPPLQAYEDHGGEGIYLQANRVIEFLTRFAPLLEQAGFGVERPAWWMDGASLHVGLACTLRSAKKAPDERKAMGTRVRLDWAALLGDTPVTIDELNELTKLPGEMQQLGGRWLRIDTVSLRDAVKFLKQGTGREIAARDALREVLGLGGRSLEIREVRSEGWIGDLLRRLRDPGQIKELAPPPGLRGEMRPYQCRGYSWLHFLSSFGLGACLADDMGLGKSLQLLALLAARHGTERPTLLVCPTSVIGNWEREVQKFFPVLRAMVHHGAQRAKEGEFAALATQHDLVLTSYSLLHRDMPTFAAVEWDGIVLDEAQNIKNFETKQSRAARQIAAGFRVALTGTPVENHVGDLYSLMEFLNPGLLGSHKDFQQRYYKPIQNQQSQRATAQLRSLTAPFVLRRLKTDRSILTDLPEKMELKTYCRLTREQARLYEDVKNGFFVDVEGKSEMERRGLILATISRLKQVCNHPAQLLKDGSDLGGRSGKLTRLTEILEEVLAAGEKALIFSQFAEMGRLLEQHCAAHFGREVLFLHGGVPRKDRDRMVAQFERPDGASLFVLSLKAGGTGLNLTAANHVFHFDRWWNPAVENQATDRAFRIGQTRAVQVHKFICMGTLEEHIDQMVEQKQMLADRVVEAGEVWLTEMSNQQLRDLFSLSREAWED
ncbi:MAG: DEAD/DEAH box helicase [Acidobacteriota bacterium]